MRELELHTDEHADYPRALRRLPHLRVTHRTVSSRAMSLGLLPRRLRVRDVLAARVFPGRSALPECWRAHYAGTITTRTIANCATHRLRYAC